MRTTRVIAPAALVLTLGSALVPAAYADTPPTCHGRSATIVGSPGGSIEGTSGDDVIVTAGARSVRTGGGSDLVCTTDTTARGLAVVAGSADVTIDASADDHGVNAYLYGGNTFVGSRYRDTVNEDLDGSSAPETISTGAGDDLVRGGLGDQGAPADPVVDLGPGNDTMDIRGRLGPDASFRGGPGRNRLFLSAPRLGWNVDLVRRRLTQEASRGTGAASVAAPLRDFTTVVDESSTMRHFAVEGTRASETIGTAYYYSDPGFRGPVDIHAGGGNDHIRVFAGLWGTVDGGAGRNDFASYTFGVAGSRVAVDLSRHRLRTDGRTLRLGHLSRLRLLGFEDATVVGTSGRDDLAIDACHATVRSLGGDDTLRLSHPGGPGASNCAGRGGQHPSVQMRADAGAGNDRVVGTPQHDVLIGGPGRDRIDGGAGRDVCRAEVTYRCP